MEWLEMLICRMCPVLMGYNGQSLSERIAVALS